MEERLRLLLALWHDGIVTADDVVRWADRQIEHSQIGAMPAWLIELSLHGPVACLKDSSIQFPQPAALSFLDRFALRVVALDPLDTHQVETFVTWAAREAMGEDLELPEVKLSYQLDHMTNDCNRMDWAVAEVRKELPALRKDLEKRAAGLLSAAA